MFCFPFAGGSASTYISWVDKFYSDIEVVLIQPPGRGARIAEKPHEHISSLVDELMNYAQHITNIPYILFGHSLGSRVAYELSCKLMSLRMPLPEYFIASGSRAPHSKNRNKLIYNLPKESFIRELEKLNGTPKEILAHKELMELFTPLLRADFKIADNYQAKRVQMPFPISVLHGKKDTDIGKKELAAWGELTSNHFKIIQLPGDHFFINEYSSEVVKQVSLIIDKVKYLQKNKSA